jgi:Tfp pilus assembly major pilin PilA
MSNTVTLNIPTSLSDIKLKEYQKYIKDVKNLTEKENPTQKEIEFSNLKLLECFCGINLKQAYKLPMTEFNSVVSHINELFNTNNRLHNKFDMIDSQGDKITFGFIPKLEDISMGEFVDLEKYIGDWQQMHKAMAILYRPIIHEKNQFYLIEEYEGSDKYSDIMKDSPIQAALGAMVFFYSLGTELSKHLMDSLANHLKEDLDFKQTLEQSGVGINQFTHSLEEMSANLKKLQNSPFLNV